MTDSRMLLGNVSISYYIKAMTHDDCYFLELMKLYLTTMIKLSVKKFVKNEDFLGNCVTKN